VCCNVLQYVATHRVAVCYSVLQFVTVCHSVLPCVAVCCSLLQCVAAVYTRNGSSSQEIRQRKEDKGFSVHVEDSHFKA